MDAVRTKNYAQEEQLTGSALVYQADAPSGWKTGNVWRQPLPRMTEVTAT